MRVDDDRVRPLPAGERRAPLRAGARPTPAYAESTWSHSPSRSAISAIGADGVDRGRRGRPDGRHDRDRPVSGRAIRGDRGGQGVGPHLVVVVDRDPDERRPAQAERHAGLLDRAVGLGRGVDAQRRDVRSPGQAQRRGVDAGRLARAGERDQRRRRGRVGEQPVERRRAGPSAWRSQSTTTSSSSVPIGEVRHSIGFWPRVAVSISPRIPGPDAVVAKYARKPGCCQCVALGSISRR